MQSQNIMKVLAIIIAFIAGMAVQAPVLANAGTGTASGRIAPVTNPSKTPSQARAEVRKLEKLSKKALQRKATKGDVFAGVALANQFSDEAQALANVPVLANSAAEDAARWYSLAAQMGALQSQSLVGISYKPLRAARRKHP